MSGKESTSACGNCGPKYGEINIFQRLYQDEDLVAEEVLRRVQDSQGFASRQCVFDGSEHESVEDNLIYMAKTFGFFIPYLEQLRDAEALLTYVGQKVGIAYACIACDTAFSDVTTAQQHMKDSKHCLMTSNIDSFLEEYGDFYAFDEDQCDGGDAVEANGSDSERSHATQNECEANEEKEEAEHSEKKGRVMSSKLKMPPTPSIRKYLRKGRNTAAQGTTSTVVAEKASAAVQSQATATVVRRAALLMVGGPAVAAVSGAPLAMAGGKACLEMAGKALDAASEIRNSSELDQFAKDKANYAKSGVPDQVMKEYHSLGWSGPRCLRAAPGNQNSEANAPARFQIMVGGKSLYIRKATFKYSMYMYDQGRSVRQYKDRTLVSSSEP